MPKSGARLFSAISTDKAARGPHRRAYRRIPVSQRLHHRGGRVPGAANPTDDLITHLAEAEIDGDRLTEREIVLTAATFVMAGVDSLSSFMSVFALNLHDHPQAPRPARRRSRR